MANEPFSIKKMLSGFINPITWSKSIVIGGILAIILIVGFTIYRAYFLKTGSNVNKPVVVALPGSTMGPVTFHSEQKVEDKKRAWWKPIPYVAVFGGARSKDNTFDFEPEYGAQAGLRWDF